MELFVELRKMMGIIAKWWWVVVVLVVISAVIGYKVSQRQPPVYRATTTIIVGQSIHTTDLTKSDIQTSELLAQTYADIARRQPVLREVIKTLDLSDSERSLKKRVKIEPVAATSKAYDYQGYYSVGGAHDYEQVSLLTRLLKVWSGKQWLPPFLKKERTFGR